MSSFDELTLALADAFDEDPEEIQRQTEAAWIELPWDAAVEASQ